MPCKDFPPTTLTATSCHPSRSKFSRKGYFGITLHCNLTIWHQLSDTHDFHIVSVITCRSRSSKWASIRRYSLTRIWISDSRSMTILIVMTCDIYNYFHYPTIVSDVIMLLCKCYITLLDKVSICNFWCPTIFHTSCS